MTRGPYGGNGRGTALKVALAIVAIAYFGGDVADALKPLASWIMGVAAAVFVFALVASRFRR